MTSLLRALAAAALAASLAAGLGGCGFTPLYADTSVGAGLTHVQVIAPQGRVGFLLRQDLDDGLGRDLGDKPAYKLELQVAGEGRGAHGLRSDATAQRYEIDLTVSYILTDLATGKVARKGTVISIASYDSADQPYAGIAARQDTEDRLAEDAAQKIQIQIAAWMASHAPG
jgi:LPS-assembly lipoprotein